MYQYFLFSFSLKSMVMNSLSGRTFLLLLEAPKEETEKIKTNNEANLMFDDN